MANRRHSFRAEAASPAGEAAESAAGSAAGLKHAARIFGTRDSLRALLKLFPHGLLIATPQRRIVLLNATCAKIFGYSQQELLGVKTDVLLQPGARARHARRCAGYSQAAAARPMGGGETRGLRKDGTEVPVSVFLNPLQVSGRSFVIAVVRDVSEQLEARDEMESFVYSASHDLRAPLRTMEGFGRALLEDYGDGLGPTAREFTERIVQAAHHMDQVIQDLLAYSRLSRAQMVLEPAELEAVLAESLIQVEAVIAVRNAQIKLPGQLHEVRCHPQTLAQVLSNLISNAIKFVPAGTVPMVTVWSTRSGDKVRLHVGDNGIGLAPEHQERIFRMFERLHGQEDYPGSGIGLAIVKKGVERMGGRVGVESRPGEGSVFWLELPPA